MTFLVSDSQHDRHAKISQFLNDREPVIAVLLAAADFEWTVRRAILALGSSSNVDIRLGVLARCSGLGKYKEAWDKEVKKRFGKGLPEVVSNWEEFKTAFELRHRLVHGVAGTTGVQFAERRVSTVLDASREVADFGLSQSIDLFGRLPIRKRKKRQ
tara:strand:- start:27801 stop:28271 length:471 start_codon:yes stop_codon:yes gene_type:complete